MISCDMQPNERIIIMAATRLSTTESINYHVVTTRGVIARTYDNLEKAVMFQTLNPTWSIYKATTTVEDVTPGPVINVRPIRAA